MLRWILMTGIGLFTLTHANGQLKKFYSLKDAVTYDTVKLSLEASTGACYFKNTSHSSPLNIYGNPDLDRINPSYHTQIKDRTCFVDLKLEEYQSSSFDQGLSFDSFFSVPKSSKKVEKDSWKVYLSDKKIYDLNLQYGIGEAYLDFSGSAVKKVKINTGNANVKVDYAMEHENTIPMDTFFVKVDLGSLEAKKINYMNASNIIAEIGFGKAILSFKEGENKKCDVNASVGAGTLDVVLPDDDTPVIIHIKDSPMCGIKIAKGFEEVEKNTYVNMSYRPDAENLLTFKVDVAIGKVIFSHQ
ncbi:MAG: hypothetical protein AAFQ94_00670 [Bacteroidota bacterium]